MRRREAAPTVKSWIGFMLRASGKPSMALNSVPSMEVETIPTEMPKSTEIPEMMHNS